MRIESLALLAAEAILEIAVAAMRSGDAQKAKDMAELAARRFAFETIQREKVKARARKRRAEKAKVGP